MHMYIFIEWSLYRTSQVTHFWVLQTTSGWAGSNAVTMECCSGARSCYLGGSLRVGAASTYIHLGIKITTRPQAAGWGGLYSW